MKFKSLIYNINKSTFFNIETRNKDYNIDIKKIED